MLGRKIQHRNFHCRPPSAPKPLFEAEPSLACSYLEISATASRAQPVGTADQRIDAIARTVDEGADLSAQRVAGFKPNLLAADAGQDVWRRSESFAVHVELTIVEVDGKIGIVLKQTNAALALER